MNRIRQAASTLRYIYRECFAARLIILTLALCPMCGIFEMMERGWSWLTATSYRSPGSTQYVIASSDS